MLIRTLCSLVKNNAKINLYFRLAITMKVIINKMKVSRPIKNRRLTNIDAKIRMVGKAQIAASLMPSNK